MGSQSPGVMGLTPGRDPELTITQNQTLTSIVPQVLRLLLAVQPGLAAEVLQCMVGGQTWKKVRCVNSGKS